MREANNCESDFKRVVMSHYDALPVLIEFAKECKKSSDCDLRARAIDALNRWDEARQN